LRRYTAGDKVGVGCMVEACGSCKSCVKFDEQYCANGSVFTYGGVTKHGKGATEKKTLDRR
jgi:uncharacterized zinc-type alcohol dehydrogenase-like protein